MIKMLALTLILLSSYTRAGNEVGGAGVAENNILYAYHNFEALVDVCLHSKGGCPLSERESELLYKIRYAIDLERKTKNQLVFLSEIKNPGYFFIEGLERIAKTEYAVGAPIYINVDLLYPHVKIVAPTSSPVNTHDRPLDIPLAISLLVHEMGHHQGERDHTFLDLLGTKVQSSLRAYVQELDGGPGRHDLIVSAYEYISTNQSDLIVRDHKKILSFTNDLLAKLKCNNGNSFQKFSFWNLHWMKEKKSLTGLVLPLRFRASLKCDSNPFSEDYELKEINMDLFLIMNPEKKFEFLEKKPKIEVFDCQRTPYQCN